MGDFDRIDNSPKPNEAKKLAVVLVLGVVLIAVMAMQFMKHSGPQPAMGNPTAVFSNLPSPVVNDDLSPTDLAGMVSDLQKDPTASLLAKTGPADTGSNAVPRNPFRMSRDWYLVLNPPSTPTANPATPATTPAIPRNSTPLQPLSLRAEDYKLTAILGTSAIINGKIVQLGALVGRARVIEIRQNAVILQPVESHTAPILELALPASVFSD